MRDIRKILLFVVLLTLLFAFLASCATPIPHGKWQNDELGLTLDATRPHAAIFPGTYVEGGAEIEIINIFTEGGALIVFRLSDWPANTGRPTDDHALYIGRTRVRRNQLRVRLDQRTQDRTGLTEIVLERIG